MQRKGTENAGLFSSKPFSAGCFPARKCLCAIMTWQAEIQALDLSDATKKEILEIVTAEIEALKTESYDEGYDDAEKLDASWLGDLEIGLRLIDTDREAAKVYLDRCTKQAGKHLIEVAPCLL